MIKSTSAERSRLHSAYPFPYRAFFFGIKPSVVKIHNQVSRIQYCIHLTRIGQGNFFIAVRTGMIINDNSFQGFSIRKFLGNFDLIPSDLRLVFYSLYPTTNYRLLNLLWERCNYWRHKRSGLKIC